MSKRFYIIVFLTLSMTLLILTASYSKTSGTTDFVESRIMNDSFAVTSELGSYSVKTIKKLDMYKDVKDSVITITNKNKDNSSFNLKVNCVDCINKIYYTINNEEPRLMKDFNIYSSELKAYGKDGDVESLRLRFFSLDDYTDKITVSIMGVKNDLYALYKNNESNNYIKIGNKIFRIVGLINNEVVTIHISNIRSIYNEDNDYIDEELLNYILENNEELIINTSIWLKDNKEYDRGNIIEASGTSMESKVIKLSPSVQVLNGTGTMMDPYEVEYES